mmetsp:Transcript_64604/g.179690  ORF Transcript_64604/g.179690 Transcript_64604/m.179690 type:complete len:218 (-) Transcript_64604:455-1108(-)
MLRNLSSLSSILCLRYANSCLSDSIVIACVRGLADGLPSETEKTCAQRGELVCRRSECVRRGGPRTFSGEIGSTTGASGEPCTSWMPFEVSGCRPTRPTTTPVREKSMELASTVMSVPTGVMGLTSVSGLPRLQKTPTIKRKPSRIDQTSKTLITAPLERARITTRSGTYKKMQRNIANSVGCTSLACAATKGESAIKPSSAADTIVKIRLAATSKV